MDDIYGWRAKLGLIFPSSSYVMEPEFNTMSPKGIITCTTRVHLEGATVQGLLAMGKEVLYGAKLLGNSEVDAIVLGCTSGSFVNGLSYNNEMIERMEEISGVPCTTTTSSIIDALQLMNISKVSIATPYIKEVNDRAKIYFEECGIEVCGMQGLDLVYDRDIHGRSVAQNYAYGKRADMEKAEAVLLLCTAMRTIPIIDALEKDINKPVISAIQASFWNTLRLAGVKEEINGFGNLLNYK